MFFGDGFVQSSCYFFFLVFLLSRGFLGGNIISFYSYIITDVFTKILGNTQSRAFLSAKKCPRISRQHFWVQKNARASVASIFECQKMPATQSPVFLSAKKCPRLSREHFWVLKNARDSVASISECKKMPAGPQRAFLRAKKCQRDSGVHFWGQKNASGTPASIFQNPPSRDTTFLTIFAPVPHRERTFLVCEVASRVGRPPFWPFLPPSHIGSGLFQSARSCPESGDHLSLYRKEHRKTLRLFFFR